MIRQRQRLHSLATMIRALFGGVNVALLNLRTLHKLPNMVLWDCFAASSTGTLPPNSQMVEIWTQAVVPTGE